MYANGNRVPAVAVAPPARVPPPAPPASIPPPPPPARWTGAWHARRWRAAENREAHVTVFRPAHS